MGYPDAPVEFNERLPVSGRPPILVPLAAFDRQKDHELIRLAVESGYTEADFAWVWIW